MLKMIEIVSHPSLCEQIVGNFAFMKAMARPEDSNFKELQNLSLDDVFKKSDAYFVEFTKIEELIITEECNLSAKLTDFLKEWEEIIDVTAIQQNIHYNLNKLDD